MGKQLFSVQALGWWQPYKCNSEHESWIPLLPPILWGIHGIWILLIGTISADCCQLWTANPLPLHLTKKTGANIPIWQLVGEGWRKSIKRERQIPSPSPLVWFRGAKPCPPVWDGSWHQKARLLQITLQTLPRQTTLNKIQNGNTAWMCLPTVFTSFEGGT